MKYLKIINSSVQDLTDQSYDAITTPSVRFISDTDEVIATKYANDEVKDIITFGELVSLDCANLSEVTFNNYINGISDGTYTSEYIKGITKGLTYDEFLEKSNTTLKTMGFYSNFSLIEEMLKQLYKIYGSYEAIEETLAYAIAYKKDYDNNISIEFTDSGATTSETFTYNQYESLVNLFDFNCDNKIDVNDLKILVAYRKFFPENVSGAGYNKAKEILTNGETVISDIIDSLLGIEEYNEDFDLNGNGIVDEEDMCFFISYHIFGDDGISEDVSSIRKVIRKANYGAFIDYGDMSSYSTSRVPPRSQRTVSVSGVKSHHHAIYEMEAYEFYEVRHYNAWDNFCDMLNKKLQSYEIVDSGKISRTSRETVHSGTDGEDTIIARNSVERTLTVGLVNQLRSVINKGMSYWDKKSGFVNKYIYVFFGEKTKLSYVGKSDELYNE